MKAGNESEKDMRRYETDATTGNLREVGMRREMQPSELEHRTFASSSIT
ncbi:hypothetical protein [Paenibacillus sp. M2]